MPSFFLQLLLSFWIATIGIFITVSATRQESAAGPPETSAANSVVLSSQLIRYALDAYAREGCSGIKSLRTEFVLVDPEGNPLCGEQLTDQERNTASSATEKNEIVGQRSGAHWISAISYTTDSGHHWVLMQRSLYRSRSWIKVMPWTAIMVPIAVTFVFAYVLTRPVRALSNAFRKFSEGDLGVRLSTPARPWSGIGGADVRSLMVDFNYMAERISDLVEAQKILVRDISHELRSPLARLRLALEMTRDEAHGDLPSLDRMELEAERVNELIGQMLSLSLIETTEEISPQEKVHLQELVTSILPNMQFEATARGCAIEVRAPNKIPILMGNAELLRRAIENVIRNAIRFTAVGTAVEVSIQESETVRPDSGRVVLGGKQQITLIVADRGPGVPESSLPHLFRAFYRTDAARRDSTGGFGVGLSIAERAIHLHGGTIIASNRPGGGLIVAIKLPALYLAS